MATTPTKHSALSFAETKELIEFARKQKVAALELPGLRIQFSPMAVIDDEPRRKKPTEEAEPAFGHYIPE